MLARLPVPIYVTAAQNDLIFDALRDAGKEPRVDFCRWHDGLIEFPTIELDFRPRSATSASLSSVREVCISPKSLALTEDNYFDFLIGMKKNNDFIPGMVKRAIADTGALVFLGFQLDDWNFRVMFRAIMDQEGGRGGDRCMRTSQRRSIRRRDAFSSRGRARLSRKLLYRVGHQHLLGQSRRLSRAISLTRWDAAAA